MLLLADHPLAGRAWDVQARRFVEPAAVEERLARADIVLLGETHDNPAHHELQLRLYRALVERGRAPALALEQLDAEHQAAIDEAAARPGASAATIAQAGKVAAGWQWSFYEPLVALALERRLPIVAANLSRPRAREVAGKGLGVLGDGEAARLAIEDVWSAERGTTLRRIMVASHCGDDSPMIDRMVVMQRARDAFIADRIAAAPSPVVAIIGRGHARGDLAVPLYLRSRFPARALVSVGFVEVRENVLQPAEYSDAAPGGHDIVWFTGRAVREDPCEKIRRTTP